MTWFNFVYIQSYGINYSINTIQSIIELTM